MKKYTSFAIAIALLLSACDFVGGERVVGSGNVTTQDRSISGFSAVQSSGFFDVYLSSGTTQSVRVEADDNPMNILKLL